MNMEPSIHHNSGAMPTAPYERPPSPPTIMIPTPVLQDASQPIKVVPSYTNIDPTSLSAADLEIITQNGKEQIAHDSALSWTYESRRVAQPVLDFLYLGPSTVARDRQWLRDHGITMLLAARDSQMAKFRLLAIDQVAQELGLQAAHVDVSGHQELIRAFPSTVRKINNHMLDIYHQQRVDRKELATGVGGDGDNMVIDQQNFRRGKVLVFCETGNSRSAAVVVAYLMAVMGMDLVQACQFVHFKRFSVSLDEDLKQVLRTYCDILAAQRTVHFHELHGSPVRVGNSKRGIDATVDEDADMGGPGDDGPVDQDRFAGRQGFVPFVDVDEPKGYSKYRPSSSGGS
ncbi:phosphatases II [Whalleya microplaca]|nr:phosphatases II [Whalleya microplaca]